MTEEPLYRELMNYALRALSRRAHTVHEMREKLVKRPQYSKDREDKVIDRLIDLNLLNDKDFIQRSIESAIHHRFQGRYKVAQKLQRKGIAMEDLNKEWDAMKIPEKEVAKNALKKIEKRLAALPKNKQYAKRTQFLASRGFSPAVIFELSNGSSQS